MAGTTALATRLLRALASRTRSCRSSSAIENAMNTPFYVLVASAMALVAWLKLRQQSLTFWKLLLPVVVCQAAIASLGDVGSRWIVAILGVFTLVVLNRPCALALSGRT